MRGLVSDEGCVGVLLDSMASGLEMLMATGKKRFAAVAAVGVAALVAVPLLIAGGASGSAEKPAVKLTASQRAADLAATPKFTNQALIAGANENWPTTGGDLGNTRYSALTQITPKNVAKLKLVSSSTYDGTVLNEVESSPIEWNGVLYFVAGNQNVVAADATTGAVRWKWTSFAPPSAGPGNHPVRGVSLGDGKIFVETDTGQLVALRASNGMEIWRAQVSLNGGVKEGSAPPTYYNGKVFIGEAGAETGRGHMDAFNAKTGALIWRSFVVGNANDDPKNGGGGVWTQPAIDTKLGLVFVSTGNDVNVTSAGDDKWTSSIVAMEIKTGKIVWGFQGVHHDIWDYDCPMSPILFQAQIKGASKNGVEFQCKSTYQFELDRKTGKGLLPIKEVPIPQAPGGSAPDPATIAANPFDSLTQPIMQGSNNLVPHCPTAAMLASPAPDGTNYDYTCTYSLPGAGKWLTFTPSFLGGATYQPNAIDPKQNMFYVCAVAGAVAAKKLSAAGAPQFAGGYNAPKVGWSGSLGAIDLSTNKTVWLDKWMNGSTCLGGVTATAGGLLFTSDNKATGPSTVFAINSKTGKQVWSMAMDQPITDPPIVYSVNGKEYVAIQAGGQVPLVGGIPAPFVRTDKVYIFSL
jgi:glucose dehydrogenase